jgi:glutaredoxin
MTCLAGTLLAFLRGLRKKTNLAGKFRRRMPYDGCEFGLPEWNCAIRQNTPPSETWVFFFFAIYILEETKKMKLYTRTVCPKCMWIKSELQRAEVEVEIINVDHDAEAFERLVAAGAMSVPVLEVEGEFIFDTNEMVKQLESLTV